MYTRFVGPAAVAVALHAILLFGFRTVHPAIVCGLRPTAVKPSPPVPPIEVVWSTASEDPPAATPKGEPEASRPEIPEPPTPDLIPEITMPPSITSLKPIDTTTQLPIGPVGKPDGKDGWTGDLGPITPDGLDNPPRTRSQLAPVYPYEARTVGRKGEVLVGFVVDEVGHVLDPYVLRSTDPLFDAPTLRAIAKWRFEPGRKGGRVVRFRMAVPVAFSVNP